MLEYILRFFKKLIPAPLFRVVQPAYHWLLAWAAAAWYGFPSRRLIVIGVTGTNGKSTVVELLHTILSEAGESVASASSIRFKVKNEEKANMLKMTMPGRFALQKFLYDAARAGCRYVILEATSEGIKQFRHKRIKFFLAILTNVTPEHIESHGGFEEYRAIKAKLFYQTPNHIVNGEDANIDYFVNIPAKHRVVYAKNDFPASWNSKLLGDFNKENIVAAYHAARFLGVRPENIKLAIEKFDGIPGRLEFVQREPFAVVVDYAHTPDALRKIYQTLRHSLLFTSHSSLVCVLGAAGGGRDKWKRPEMGEIAAEFCNEIILTNEDPYDENPLTIVKEIESGFSQTRNPKPETPKLKTTNEQQSTINYKLVMDRREAIRAAISHARPSDVVIITGKGCEPWMMVAGGKKIPWDDREIAREELQKLHSAV